MFNEGDELEEAACVMGQYVLQMRLKVRRLYSWESGGILGHTIKAAMVDTHQASRETRRAEPHLPSSRTERGNAFHVELHHAGSKQ